MKIILKKFIWEIFYMISLVLLVVGGWITWNFIYNKNVLVAGWMLFFMTVFYITFFIGMSFVIVFKCKKTIIRILVSITIVVGVFYYLFFPNSQLYLNIDYQINKENRNTIVNMLHDGSLQENWKMGENKFKCPIRSASYTNSILCIQKENYSKILFFSYRGLYRGTVVIYVSNDTAINEFDFGYHYENINKVESNWYTATIK